MPDSEPIPADLINRVAARLAARRAASDKAARTLPVSGGLDEAAAVLASFDPRMIHETVGEAEPESVDELLAHSEETVDASGARRWTLTPEIRVANLRQLREQGRVSEALAANPQRPDDPLQLALEAYLTATAEPIERQSLHQLGSTYQACEWLRAAGFERLPERDSILRRTEWLTLLEPFEYIAGTFFRGRARELQRLRSYAGVLPPESFAARTRRRIESVFSLDEKPPLLVYGPGGIGKSALLGRFILEHAKAHEEDRFPFVYLDFDRPDVEASEPLTLLIEALRQLGIEYPHARASCERIRESWLELLGRQQPAAGDQVLRDVQSVARTRSAAVRDFATLIDSLGANDRPVLFVLDTFEEVQWRSEEYVAAIWRLLEELQPTVTRLRVCVAGRGQIPGHTMEELELREFDEDAAVGYLQARGVTDPEVARRLAHQVGGSPMSLKLAADLVEHEGLQGGKLDIATRGLLFIRVDDGVIQRQLYRRLLGHIHNQDVRKLAHPGLVLRRLTPELILEVLNEPCDLGIHSLAEARELFAELRREVSLVTVAGDGALEHRPDLRRLMLDLLERDEPQKARAIRELAVAFYERQAPRPLERAEEIYHRLSLGQDSAVVDRRWLPGVEPYLRDVLPELHATQRAYLASRLGIVVEEATLRLADLEDWERLVERKVRELLAEEQLQEALRLMGSRADRTRRSPLFGLQATALARLGRWPESLAVLDEGIDRGLTDGERQHALDLTLQRAEIMLASMLLGGSPDVLSRLDGLSKSSPAPAERLNVAAHRLALGRAAAALTPQNSAELGRELRDLFDALLDEVFGEDPTLARWVASVFDGEDVARLSRLLRVCGLPRTDRPTLRQLAAAIAQLDLGVSNEAGEAPGMLARGLGVPVHDSLTASWSEFLLTANDTTVRDVLARLLLENARFVQPGLIEAFASVMRASLGIDPHSAQEPPDTMGTRHPASRMTGREREDLAQALASVFPSPDALRQFLRYRLDRSLDAIALTTDLRSTIMSVIQIAEREAWLTLLVAKAREAFPADAALAGIAERLGLSTLVPGDPAFLERMVGSSSSIDLAEWRERLGAIEGQVCQVEIAGRGVGTGFLVGVDLVLTAAHVLGPMDKADISPREGVRFDYKADRRGPTVITGTFFGLDDIVARGDRGERPDRLDYALLRVHGSPGAQPIGGERGESGGALRRWIEALDPPPRIGPHSGLVMVQHPRGQPLKLTLNPSAVVALSPDGARAYYDLETAPGSSGSPCFTYDLQLVALNIASSAGDPTAPSNTSIGVLMSAVLRDLREQGFGQVLGAVFA